MGELIISTSSVETHMWKLSAEQQDACACISAAGLFTPAEQSLIGLTQGLEKNIYMLYIRILCHWRQDCLLMCCRRIACL